MITQILDQTPDLSFPLSKGHLTRFKNMRAGTQQLLPFELRNRNSFGTDPKVKPPTFRYRTRKSWSQERRVVGKAEHLSKGANPRFVVTSLSEEEADARHLYEDLYSVRGDMENRIKLKVILRCARLTGGMSPGESPGRERG